MTGIKEAGSVTAGLETEISYDTLSHRYISDLHHRFGKKVFNPDEDSSATVNLLARRQGWRNNGDLTIFTSGVFDLLHMDHMAYLLHAKATAAAVHYDQQGYRRPWDKLDIEQQQDYTNKALSEQALKLIVSVDGDKSVAYRKGNNPEKRGVPTPVYGWITRAMMVASLSFVDPTSETGDALLPTVDAVTIHGPQDFPNNSPHASHFDLVGLVQPDVWVVFGESQDIIDEAPRRPDLAQVALRCIGDIPGAHYFEDPTMGRMNTGTTIKRIRGEL